MFRGKESSNIIKLSQLVQEIEFWYFQLPVALGGGGWVDGGVRLLGGVPTHVHIHVHACTHMYAHASMVNMIISCKWPPSLGESLGIPYDVIHACVCVHMHVYAYMCMCVGAPSHQTPPTSTHPQGGPLESVKI